MGNCSFHVFKEEVHFLCEIVILFWYLPIIDFQVWNNKIFEWSSLVCFFLILVLVASENGYPGKIPVTSNLGRFWCHIQG